MANQLDLEEQEQLDQLKHFWQQYGNLITWGLIIVLGAIGVWNGYQFWQRKQSMQSAAMFEEVEKLVRMGDAQKAERAFVDMRERFSSAVYTQQAGLMLAKMSYETGKVDVAKAALAWVAEHSSDKGYASLAYLRLSGILVDTKAYDDALKLVNSGVMSEFSALAADRRGDIHVLQGRRSEAKVEYQKAFGLLDERTPYRRMVGIKLGALGVDPESLVQSTAQSTIGAEGTK